MLSDIQKQILQAVADMADIPKGAVNIRSDGKKHFRQNTDHIRIESKTDKDGIDIHIDPFTKNESVHIPVVLTQSGFHDHVYNDFYIGEGAEVTIVAGCGIHNCGGVDMTSRHDGVHTFHVGKNAKVKYVEKHYGDGDGTGERIMNPQTVIFLAEGATMEMESTQIKGVDSTDRKTTATLADRATLIVHEKLMTHGKQFAITEFEIDLNGEGCATHAVSRSVAARLRREAIRMLPLASTCSVRVTEATAREARKISSSS